jgi:hypothetical protein
METYLEEERLLESARPPEPVSDEGAARNLEVAVLFTSIRATIAAAHCASKLLKGLDGRISLIEALPVPYPLPLDKPQVSLHFTKRRLRTLVEQSGIEMTAQIFLCRFRFEALLRILKPGALVVMGCRKRLWPTWEKRLAKKLRHAGYQTVVIES